MKRLQGIFILGVLVFLFFLPDILRPNAVYAPADMIYLSQPWRAYSSTMPHNVLQGDGALMFIPFRSFYYNQVHEHRFPLWNPYIYGGAPFFANDQSGVLSVYNLVSLPFSFAHGFLVMAILRIFVAGLGAYLLLDLFGLGISACLLGSLAWMFSAYMIMYLHLLTSTAAGSFIPWLFYFFERLVRAFERQSKFAFLNMFGISAIVGLSFLAGHAETTAVGVTGLVLYAVVKLAIARGHSMKGLLYMLAGITLGTLIAAVQLLPFIQILLNSEPLLYRTATVNNAIVRPLYALTMMWFVPYINAGSVYSYLWNHYLNNQTFVYAYIGMAPFLLSIYALFHGKENGKQTIPFMVTALAAICITLHIPPFSWLLTLPLFAAGGSWYYVLADFSLSMLAGFGAGHILKSDARLKLNKRWLAAVTAALLMFLTILYLITRFQTPWVALLLHGALILKSWLHTGVQPAVVAFFMTQFLIALFFIAGSVILLIKAKAEPRTAVVCLILLTVTDLFLFGMNYNPDPPAADLTRTTPIIQRLKELSSPEYTCYAGDDIMVPDLNMNYGIRYFSGYDITVSLMYQRFLFALFPGSTPLLGNNGSDPRSRPGTPPDHVIASIAGIRYLLFTSSTYLNPSSYKLLGTYKDISLWENPDAKPLLYLADSITPVMSGDEAFRSLSTHDPKLMHTSIVTDIDETGALDNAKIRLTRIKDVPGEHVVKVDAGSNGFLVINEPYYPGWHASINNRDVRMYQVNYLFQGIKLPAGTYTVKITYAPRMVYIGLIVSAITIFLMAGVVVIKII